MGFSKLYAEQIFYILIMHIFAIQKCLLLYLGFIGDGHMESTTWRAQYVKSTATNKRPRYSSMRHVSQNLDSKRSKKGGGAGVLTAGVLEPNRTLDFTITCQLDSFQPFV